MHTQLILWTARLAVMLYLLSWVVWFSRSKQPLERNLYQAGFVMFVLHLASAFHWEHNWSHRDAWESTAKQTEEMFGWNWGGGVWFNYLFALVWGADLVWAETVGKRERSRTIRILVQLYLAFITFNATVVFGSLWWWSVLGVFAFACWSMRRE